MELLALPHEPGESDLLWKYMDLQKFLAIIINKQFYYSRLDQLDDSYEGINQGYLSQLLLHELNKKDDIINTDHRYYQSWFFGKPLRQLEAEFSKKQKLNYVTCWITGSRESTGMWNLYSGPGSVAIKVKYSSLVKFLNADQYEFEMGDHVKTVHFGRVKYKDFLDRFAVQGQEFQVRNTAFRKDLSFQHEREFRICVTTNGQLPEGKVGIRQTFTSFEKLSVEVIVHPKSTSWQYENILKVVETFAPWFKVCPSELKWRL